jgi:hypothetical protein
VALEVFPRLELGIRTEPALDLANRPTCPVGLRGCEQRLVPSLEYSWDFEELVIHLFLLLLLLHGATDVVHRFLYTPLDPNQLSVRSFYRISLLETRSQQGSRVNSPRVRGREPLRSASRLLGFIIDLCFWDPGHRLVAGPSPRLRYLQDPLCPASPALTPWTTVLRKPTEPISSSLNVFL